MAAAPNALMPSWYLAPTFAVLRRQHGARPHFHAGRRPHSQWRAAGGTQLQFLAESFCWRPTIVNKTITLNGHNMTVIGVAQAGFDGVQLGDLPKYLCP